MRVTKIFIKIVLIIFFSISFSGEQVFANTVDGSDKEILLNANNLVKQKRFSEAKTLLMSLAIRGNPEAQYRLAVLYRNGYVIKADYKRAFSWFEKSAKQGYVKSIYAIGMMKLRGQGTERDTIAAEKLFVLASKLDYAPAIDQLMRIRNSVNYSLTEKDHSVFRKSIRTGHVARVKRYLKRNIDINRKDVNGYDAFMLAIEAKQSEIIKLLSEYAPDYAAVNHNNETALMIAVKGGSEDVALELLRHPVVAETINTKDKFGNSALLLAVKYNAEKLVLPLVREGADMYLPDAMNRDVYMVAKDKEQKEVLKQLIEAGYVKSNKRKIESFIVTPIVDEIKPEKNRGGHAASDNAANEKGSKKKIESINPYLNWSALMVASWRGDSQSVNDLVKTTADINLVDEAGHSALTRASWKGSVKIVDTLLRHKANVQQTQLDGSTALHWAAKYNHPKVVKVLLRGGAEVNVLRNDGKSALILAAISATNERNSLTDLIKGNASLDIKDNDGKTALIHAVISGNLNSVKTLIDSGANVNLLDQKGRSPLWYAINGNKKEIGLALVAAKANVNQRDGDDNYLLTFAANMGNDGIVKDLLSHNAKVDAQTQFGNTSLVIASGNGNENIVKLLVIYKADVNHKNAIGDTPLIAAAKNKHIGVAELLIGVGADISKKNKKRLRAIDFAKATENTPLIKILTDHKKQNGFWKF